MVDDVPEGWGVYRKLILAQLDQLHDDVLLIRNKLDTFRQEDIAALKTDIALLKFKSSMWGALAGAGTSVLVASAAVMLKYVN